MSEFDKPGGGGGEPSADQDTGDELDLNQMSEQLQDDHMDYGEGREAEDMDSMQLGMATADLDLDQDYSSQCELNGHKARGNDSDVQALAQQGELGKRSSFGGGQNCSRAEESCGDGAECVNKNLDSSTLSSTATNIDQSHTVSKRNSLEVRNNIPDVNEVKDGDSSAAFDLGLCQAQGAIPKMKKKSPGLARRMVDTANAEAERDASSSEKELESANSSVIIDNTVISAQKDFESHMRNGGVTGYTSRGVPYNDSPEWKEGDAMNNVRDNGSDSILAVLPTLENGTGFPSQHPLQPPRHADIKNEYDYVKYARIQDGDSYVGMRLAFSSSNDSLVFRPGFSHMRSSDEEPYLGSSREGSPEKMLAHHSRSSMGPQMKVSSVNEESLTEIPLNGSDQAPGDEQRNFSLSPEATECDSVEVESIMSEEGKSSTSGMPIVEDGLSSSDTEDNSLHDNTTANQPAEILRRRHKAEIANELNNHLINDKHVMQLSDLSSEINLEMPSPSHSEVTNTSVELPSPTSSDVSQMKREAVDLAIRDIQSAIQRSRHHKKHHKQPQHRQSSARSSISPDDDNSYHESTGDSREMVDNGDSGVPPIWVMRDSYVRKVQRQEDVRKVRQEIDHQQENDYRNKEQDQVYQVEGEEEGLMKYQYSRNDGKAYQTPRDYDTDEETDELLDKQYVRSESEQVDIPELSRPPVNRSAQAEKRRTRAREVTLRDPDNETVLIEGVLFRARYLGSTQLISEGNPSKPMRMMQAQEAVGRIKAPDGENQPSTEVDLFISTEKIMVLNTDLQEIMMDHSLRTISYIADIGEILVIMARRGPVTSPGSDGLLHHKRQSKICCHVFESNEAQLIAQSIGQAFQVAYMEFLKANGIEDPGLMKEIDYQEVLNQQEIFGEELHLFSNKEMQKEVVVPKLKNEPLGVVIVESGWGSMVPTVVLANMSPTGAAARGGQLNIGDQIMSINGVSLVGLPLSSCQNYIKAARNQTVVKLNVVSCPPVVEVLIKRPDVKYQLGFSVQNGVICSLLRGGIAERGGVRVGHRIIEINGQSVVAVPHEKIVNMLATSVGEIHMKTMPTSIFRLLTGQDVPHFI